MLPPKVEVITTQEVRTFLQTVLPFAIPNAMSQPIKPPPTALKPTRPFSILKDVTRAACAMQRTIKAGLSNSSYTKWLKLVKVQVLKKIA